LPKIFAALDAGFGELTMLPVHPRPDVAAIRMLVRATKGSRAAPKLLPGIILNGRTGEVADEIQGVLRGTAVLPLAVR
jgi:tRNA1(Val) A37 N6-methylase TrmN6